ncbi:MAG: CopG family transcriptional regulator, nickel-responsive regulator [Methanolobus sp.]|nr:CopG family transcriptional regulator, nickel-responsive regulator [Methanolobus sp.]MDK2948406.1 CopG family transcriptional regulator, nickel-responsive regulator [Methanolobus sp.]
MSGTAVDINIGDYLARRIDSRVREGYAHSREELVKKAIVHYLEDLDMSKRRSELFREVNHSAQIMRCAWKEPVPADKALEILAAVGEGATKEEIDSSIKDTRDLVDRKFAQAHRDLTEQ